METGAESDRLVLVVDSMGQAEQPRRKGSLTAISDETI
jgi:hypothetical protein